MELMSWGMIDWRILKELDKQVLHCWYDIVDAIASVVPDMTLELQQKIKV